MTGQAKIIVHSSDKVVEEMTLIKGQNLFVRAMEGVTYEIRDVATGTAPAEFVIKRIGNDLELYLDPDSSMPDLILENYYTLENPSPLVGIAEDGQYYTYVPQTGKEELLAWNMEDGDAAYQSLGYETAGSAIPWWPILLGGLLLLGAGAALAGSSGGGSGTPKDTTAPDAPTDLDVSDDGDQVTGKGEPGAEVIIKDPDGDIIGTGEVDDNGDFEVDIDPPQTNGEELEVTLVDDAGNESVPKPVEADDNTAPDAPGHVQITDDGVTVTGTGEEGADVIIKDPDGNTIGTGVVDENGDFTVEIDPALINKEELEVTLVDDSGNTSLPTGATASDSTPPEAPIASITDDGTTIFGTGEPGTTITVTDPSAPLSESTLGTAIVDGDGNYTVTLDTPKVNEEALEVTSTDEAGNVSPATPVTAPDGTPPSAPTIIIGDGDEYISASEVDSNTVTVTITLPSDAIAGDSLNISGETLVLTEAQITAGEVDAFIPVPADGETLSLSATLTDSAGNESAEGTASAIVDTTGPETGDGSNSISFSDTLVNAAEAESGVALTGQVEDGATIDSILIEDSAGKIIAVYVGDITVAADGTVTVEPQNLSTLADGELTVTMTVSDSAGNTGGVTNTAELNQNPAGAPAVTIGDGNEFITDDEINPDNTVSVTIGLPADAVAGDTVEGLDDDIVLTEADIIAGEVTGTVIAPGEGAPLDLSVSITDVSGNTSEAGTASAVVDTTAPVVTVDELKTNDTTPALTGTVDDTNATVVVTVNGTDYPANNNGNGTWTLADDTLPDLGEGDTTIEVTAVDPAGNTGTIIQNITVDSAVPGVTFDNLSTQDTTPELTGTVDDNSAVITVNVNGTDYPATNNGDGTWTLVDDTLPELAEGSYSVTVTAESTTGEVGIAGGNLIIDLTGPVDGDGKNSIVFDDDFVNSTEATGTTLSGKIEPDATLNSMNITDGVNTIPVDPADITVAADGTVTVIGQDLSSLEDGILTVTMAVTDAAGNSGQVTDTTILSTTSPTAEIDYEEVGGELMSVINGSNAEPGSTVMVADANGDPVGDLGVIVDAVGEFTVPLNELYIDGESFFVTFDPAAVDTLEVIAPVSEVLLAADNNEQLVLDIEPTVTDNGEITEGLLSLLDVGTGGVADVDVIETDSFMAISVAEGTERELTLKAAGGGLTLANTYDLVVYKLDEELGEYVIEEDRTVSEWFTIILFYAESQETSFVLPEGEYRLALVGAGVSVLGQIDLTTVVNNTLDYNNPASVSGNITGNVIDDLDANAGEDVVSNTTTVQSVTFGGGAPVLLSSDGQLTIIEGTYGTLEINSNGGYIYTANEDSAPGQTDVFEYTIVDTANPEKGVSTAELTIELTREESDLFINTDTVALTFEEPIPQDITDEGRIESITNVGLVGVGLGPIADVNVFPDQEETMSIVVDDDTVREITLHATGFGLGVLDIKILDLVVYRKDDSGDYVLVHQESDWYTYGSLVIGVGTSDPLTLTLPAGEYIAFLQGDSVGIDIGSGTTMEVTQDILTDYSNLDVDQSISTGELSLGEPDGDDLTSSEVLSVNGTKLVDGAPVVIEGEYGTLTVNSDGTYSYLTKDDLTSENFGDLDSFSYIYKGEDGERAAGRLNLKLDGSEVVDDELAYTIGTQVKIDHTFDENYNYDNENSKGHDPVYEFTLQEGSENTIKIDITAEVKNTLFSDDETELSYHLVRIEDSGDVVVASLIEPNAESSSIHVTLNETNSPLLIAGDYELRINSTDANESGWVSRNVEVIADVIITSTFPNEREVASLPVESGDLFTNDSNSSAWSELVINNEHMYVQGTLGHDNNSVEVVGEYGTLTVNNDGSYTYQADGEGMGEDVFDYMLTSAFGTTSTGQLTVTVGHDGPDDVTYPWTSDTAADAMPVASISSFSFAGFDETAIKESEGDESELPSLDSLVDDSESLTLDGESIAGPATSAESGIDPYAPVSAGNSYLDEDTSAGDALV